MTFFSRPILSDEQFKQLSGTTLTLSGQTKIYNSNGLAISNGSGNTILINAKGAAVGNVLTYDGNEIKLSSPSSGASTGIYVCASPTTCTVGGLVSGTSISGCSIGYILEKILVPTVSPVVVSPTISFLINPSTTCYEVGTNVNITGCLSFSRGTIIPQYCGTCCFRSGLPNTHRYQDFNGTFCNCVLTTLTSTYAMPVHTITAGNNTAYGTVCYDAGPTPAYNSNGSTFCTQLPAGCSTSISQTICGLYPYFYGKVSSGGCPAGVNRPVPSNALINTGTKVVGLSTGTININFNSGSDDYVWFAIPNASTSKTKWFVDSLNNGNIGGGVSPGCNLFPVECVVSPVTTACWGGQTYKVYVSNYQSAVTSIMELRNS